MKEKRTRLETGIILLTAVVLMITGISKLVGLSNSLFLIFMFFSGVVVVYYYKKGKL